MREGIEKAANGNPHAPGMAGVPVSGFQMVYLLSGFPRLQIVWVDQGYNGDLGDWMKNQLGWRLEIVKRTAAKQQEKKAWDIARQRARDGATVVEMCAGLTYGRGIKVLPRRWVVECTFAWLSKSRRLARVYEFLPSTREATVYITMTRLMLKRLDKAAQLTP